MTRAGGKSTIALAVLVTAVVALSAKTAWADEFKYPVPAGFLDLSVGAPAANHANVSPALVEQAREFHGYAVLLENEEAKVIFTVATRESDLSVRGLADGIVAALPEQKQYFDVRVLANERVQIDGFQCRKLEFVATVEGRQFSKLSYILPLGSARALMSLEGSPEELAKARGAFESSVRSVSGLAPSAEPSNAGKIAVALGVLLMIVIGLMQRSRTTKKRAKSPLPEGKSDRTGA